MTEYLFSNGFANNFAVGYKNMVGTPLHVSDNQTTSLEVPRISRMLGMHSYTFLVPFEILIYTSAKFKKSVYTVLVPMSLHNRHNIY